MRDRLEALVLSTEVEAVPHELAHADAIAAVAGADVVFGCVDSTEGRHLLNCIASFCALPYFDVGVPLIADGQGGIEQVCGTLHYLQPGCSSPLTRDLDTLEQVRAANLRRADPEAFAGDRAFKLGFGGRSEYGSYVKPVRGAAPGRFQADDGAGVAGLERSACHGRAVALWHPSWGCTGGSGTSGWGS